MLSKRDIERLAGVAFLGLLVSLIVAVVAEVQVDTRRDEFSETLLDIVAHPRRYLGWLAFDFIGNLLTVPLAVLLYVVFRSHERNLALFGSFMFLAAGVTFMVTDMTAFALRNLAQDFALFAGSEETQAEATAIFSSARGLALVGEFAELVAGTFLSLALLSYGALVVWSRAVPRWLGWLSVAGGALVLFFWLDLAVNGFWVVGLAGLILILLLQLSLGGWLLLRGTAEPPAGQAA